MFIDEIIENQKNSLKTAYEDLRDIMPPMFFKLFGEKRVSKILPLLCNFNEQAGIRRLDFEDEHYLVYFKNNDNNIFKTSIIMANYDWHNVIIQQSIKTINNNYLVIECYYLDNENIEKKYSYEEIKNEYIKQFKHVNEEELKNIYNRLNFYNISELRLPLLASRLELALRTQNNDNVIVSYDDNNSDLFALTISVPFVVKQEKILSDLLKAVSLSNCDPVKICFRHLTHGENINDFEHKAVLQATIYMSKTQENIDIKLLTKNIKMVPYVDMDDLIHKYLVDKNGFSLEDGNLIRAILEFTHAQFSFIDIYAYSKQELFVFISLYPEISKELIDQFYLKFKTYSPNKLDLTRYYNMVNNINSGISSKDILVKNFFLSMANFLENLYKCNFFVEDKSALSFRLSGKFMNFYMNLSDKYKNKFAKYPIPLGVFFFYRCNAIGFQVRFSEIARGGWRSVVPSLGANDLEKNDSYDVANDDIYSEVFILAHTQHLKNKDIYEGGSKMITLLKPIINIENFKPILWQVQRTIAQAFISLINYDENGKLKDKNIVDYLNYREIIEIGPDENMFDDMIDYLGKYAKKVGYTLGSGIISGKVDSGINHKEYGVTSFGVHQYFLKTLEELNINYKEDSFSIKIAGGPSGDVAGNEMKLLLEKDNGKYLMPNMQITAITDGPAAIYDPAGIDKEELEKLILKNALDKFNPQKLQGDGAYIIFSKPQSNKNKECHQSFFKKNNNIEEKLISRDEFMLLFQNNLSHYADIFIPAGGRPSTINESNIEQFFPNDIPSFKAIIEGANSFITPFSRNEIQRRGVRIIKDASANKCGVITSSYEILSGIMLDEEEFKQEKELLVKEVMNILKLRASKEATYLYSIFNKNKDMFLTDITEKLSHEINDSNIMISNYIKEHPELITDELILSHLPNLFSIKYRDRINRLPVEYKNAIASTELACRMIYASEEESLGNKLTRLINQ